MHAVTTPGRCFALVLLLLNKAGLSHIAYTEAFLLEYYCVM